jgi:hypothetical protein
LEQVTDLEVLLQPLRIELTRGDQRKQHRWSGRSSNKRRYESDSWLRSGLSRVTLVRPQYTSSAGV